MVKSSVNPQNLTPKPVKLLCSYGGRILPRYPDGKLRYHGGQTRVISVDRSISFSDLLVKMKEIYPLAVSLRCQLPTEDLDALITIKSEEDLRNLIEEYDQAAAEVAAPPPSSLKIRAFLFCPKFNKKVSPPQSSASSSSSSSNGITSPVLNAIPPRFSKSTAGRCVLLRQQPARKYPAYGNGGGHVYLIHNGNYWQ